MKTVTKRNLAKDLIELDSSKDFWERSRNKLLLKYVKKSPVCDLGCGAGLITKTLLKKGFDVTEFVAQKRLGKFDLFLCLP